ncbi:MAG TPA: ABC transporter ATP-binding protein [Streptosporangiaceae bacterium]|nr:ABC transporter ATP-binding protein [Streptosporangiaceae bacterium]
MSAIAVERLVKRYGPITAVHDVSFEVAPGQVTALLGPNGAGKSTIIEILTGLTAPSGGTVRVLGTVPRPGGRPGRSWRARIGLVLQSESLDPQLTVTEALALYSGLYPRPLRVAEVLAAIDLAADAGTRIGVLSGGQRRRVDLGLGIIGRPELLFLDEPTTGLDPEARRQLWEVIGNLIAGGATVLLTTHYLEEAERLAGRLIVLARGQVVADTTPGQLRASGPPPAIRLPLQPGSPVTDLPAWLDVETDAVRRELVIRCADFTAGLESLVGWARRNRIDLTGLELGPPSLEDAYLALTADPGQPRIAEEELSHG